MIIDTNRLLAICIIIIIILILGIFGINGLLVLLLGWFLLTFPISREKVYIGSSEKFISKKDDFPYKKLNIKLKDLNARFQRLKDFKFDIVPHKYYIKNIRPELLQYNGKQMVINHPKSYYETYDNISDYFIEPMRVKCVRSDQKQSVHEYWVNNKAEVKSHCKTKYGKLNTHNLRESLFDLMRECNTFKPSLLVGFAKMFEAKSILDISAGWGDRLIASLACNIDYIGVDPADLHNEYKQMIEHFEHTSSAILIKGKFEDPQILKDISNKVDMIFSSPPFYDLEKYYSLDSSQSYKNRSVDEWFNDFLLVSVKKAWSFLKQNGHMVLYIADAYNRKPYVQRLIDEVGKFGDSKYLGCLPQMDLDQKIPRPFWIWEKVPEKNGGLDLMPGIIGF